MRTVTRRPPSGEAASATSPPWLRATSRAMVSPSPWRGEPSPLYVAYPSRRYQPARIKVLLGYLEGVFG